MSWTSYLGSSRDGSGHLQVWLLAYWVHLGCTAFSDSPYSYARRGGPGGPVAPPHTPSVVCRVPVASGVKARTQEGSFCPTRQCQGGGTGGEQGVRKRVWLGRAGGRPVRGPGAQHRREAEVLCGGWAGGSPPPARPRARLRSLLVVFLCLLISTLLLDTLLSRQMGPDAKLTSGEEFFIFKKVKGKNHLESPPRPLNGDASPGAPSFP